MKQINDKPDIFDNRQISQIKALIVQAKAEKISLPKFVNDQWHLLDIVEKIDVAWKESYLSMVNEIETSYALTVQDGLKPLSTEDKKAVGDPLDQMTKAISTIDV